MLMLGCFSLLNAQNGSKGYCIKREYGSTMTNGVYFSVFTFINNCDKPLVLEIYYTVWKQGTKKYVKKKKLKPQKRIKIILPQGFSSVDGFEANPVPEK
jgi:hypothetical protein